MAHTVLKLLGRPALHAKTLGFTHPVSGRRLSFASALPEDFERALEALSGLGTGRVSRRLRHQRLESIESSESLLV